VLAFWFQYRQKRSFQYYTKSFLDTPETIIRKAIATGKAALFKSGVINSDLVLVKKPRASTAPGLLFTAE